MHTADLLPVQCSPKVRDIWVGYWSKVDEGLGKRVQSELQQALKAK